MRETCSGRRSAILLALTTAAVPACQKQTEAGSTPPPLTQRLPSFRFDVLPVLQRHCASADGCHGEKPTDSVRLDMRPAAAYDQLVGKPAQERKEALRMKPGEPAASFVIDKLAGVLRPGEGKSMPIDSKTGAPLEPSPLPPDYVEKILKPWILAGAPNN